MTSWGNLNFSGRILLHGVSSLRCSVRRKQRKERLFMAGLLSSEKGSFFVTSLSLFVQMPGWSLLFTYLPPWDLELRMKGLVKGRLYARITVFIFLWHDQRRTLKRGVSWIGKWLSASQKNGSSSWSWLGRVFFSLRDILTFRVFIFITNFIPSLPLDTAVWQIRPPCTIRTRFFSAPFSWQ